MFTLYTLQHCPYSQEALHALELLEIPHRNIVVKMKDKDKYKKKHQMDTFPQIFLKENKKIIKIGGFRELVIYLRNKCKT